MTVESTSAIIRSTECLGCGTRLDEDGHDVDRDGILTVAERYTNAEEYAYGTPSNWTTELDGLRVMTPLGQELPFGLPAPRPCHRPACGDRVDRPLEDDIWLKLNPLDRQAIDLGIDSLIAAFTFSR